MTFFVAGGSGKKLVMYVHFRGKKMKFENFLEKYEFCTSKKWYQPVEFRLRMNNGMFYWKKPTFFIMFFYF